MKIESILSEKYIALNLELETKEQVIERMLSIISEHSGVKDIDRLRADVLRREGEMSTGIGRRLPCRMQRLMRFLIRCLPLLPEGGYQF